MTVPLLLCWQKKTCSGCLSSAISVSATILMFQHLTMHCFYQFLLLMFSIFTRILSLAHLFYAYCTHGPNTSAWSKHSTTILGEPGLANPRGMYYNGKEGRKEGTLANHLGSSLPHRPYWSAPPRAERVIKATRCDWLLDTTNVDFARTLQDFRLTDSIFESVRRLLSWSGQQHTNVLASLRPAYITQLLGVSRQIIRHLGVSRLMYARQKQHGCGVISNSLTAFFSQ